MSLYKSYQSIDKQVRCKKFIGDLFGSNVNQDSNPNFAQAQQGYAPSNDEQAANRAQQQAFVQQLQGQANGTSGPSAAQQMLQNATQANTANAHALQASQQGNVNQGLATRNAMNAAAQNNQQAAGQGALMRQQEMQNATQQLGGQLNTMQGQGAQAQQANTAAGLNATGINAQLASGNAQNNGQIAGGIAGTVGKIFGMPSARGGMVPHFDEGGDIPSAPALNNTSIASRAEVPAAKSSGGGNTDMLMKVAPLLLASGGDIPLAPQFAPSPSIVRSGNPYAAAPKPAAAAPAPAPAAPKASSPYSTLHDALSGAMSSAKSAISDAILPGPDADKQEPKASGDMAMYAKGGKIDAIVSPGEGYLKPKEVKKVAEGKENPIKAAEKIPGKPKVPGAVNSYANDTVPKKLESGGIILPRSVMKSSDPTGNAAKFVAAVMAKQGRKLK